MKNNKYFQSYSRIHIMCKLLFYVALSVATAISAGTVQAAEALTLTFSRTGTTASAVSVNATGINGVTASLVSSSHNFKATHGATTSSILCPNVNGNTRPTITLQFSISGLPSTLSLNALGLNIHALNANDEYQTYNDNKSRQYNVSASINGNTFGSLYNFDIAAGVNPSGTRNKVWTIDGSSAVSATSPLTLTLTISAGTTNEGCFFGLSAITLNTEGSTPDPDPDPEPDENCYLIKWKANTSDYMQQLGDKFVVGNYAVTSSCFWQLEPTGKTNCYYVRNIATGMYIGSCNMEPGSSSKVMASAAPVEYYIGNTSGTSAEIRGCVWMSSTDCTGYNYESGARALNKDGASSDIITWQNGTSRVGSYWTLVPTQNLYELRPFTPAPAIGQATYFYYLQSTDGKALTTSLTWADKDAVDSQKWYFVGVSAATGGYQIIAAEGNIPAFEGRRFTLKSSETPGYFRLTDSDGEILSVDGKEEFFFSPFRIHSKFALDSQIYTLPCGSLGEIYVSRLTVSTPAHLRDLHYPMAIKSGSEIIYPVAERPSGRYNMLSNDYAVVTPGKCDINITLNESPAASTRIFIYFDWNRDGVFEDMHEVSASQNIQTTVDVPANTVAGQSRMRVRITDNGLIDADDDVNGQVLDLFVRCIPTDATMYNPIVDVNAANRGTATYDETTHTATATAAGTATFLYWAEDKRIHSLDSECSIEPSATQRKFTAVFSPNLDETVGVDNIIPDNTDEAAKIYVDDREIKVSSTNPVTHIYVFALDGSLAAHNSSCYTLHTDNLVAGIYIVKAVTTSGTASSKIIIR